MYSRDTGRGNSREGGGPRRCPLGPAAPPPAPRTPAGGTRRVRLVRGEGRGVSDYYRVRDAACPLSTRRGGGVVTRRHAASTARRLRALVRTVRRRGRAARAETQRTKHEAQRTKLEAQRTGSSRTCARAGAWLQPGEASRVIRGAQRRRGHPAFGGRGGGGNAGMGRVARPIRTWRRRDLRPICTRGEGGGGEEARPHPQQPPPRRDPQR